jgi:hypothetical protein
MIEKIKKAGTAFAYGVESFTYTVLSPPAKALDWLAKKWIGQEIEEKDSFIKFLESSLAEQRLSIARYIQQNKVLTERLSREGLLITKELLANSAARQAQLLLVEQNQNNEKLNESNAKMRAAGDALAELVALNKPKKHVSKKDRDLQKAIDDWNKNSR